MLFSNQWKELEEQSKLTIKDHVIVYALNAAVEEKNYTQSSLEKNGLKSREV